jgi:hypothetical protein
MMANNTGKVVVVNNYKRYYDTKIDPTTQYYFSLIRRQR